MYRLIGVLTLLNLSLANVLPRYPGGRIVNGVNTTIEAHPYQVSIQASHDHFCGGSIINEDTIVTAAHCVKSTKPSEIKVRLGSTNYMHGGEYVAVRALKSHEDFNAFDMKYDVAVIKLATPVRQSWKVRYIELAKVTPKTGTPAVVSGWGALCYRDCPILPAILQEVEVNVIDQQACASTSFQYGSEILDTMLCAYAEHKDACQCDSGGPLVANNQLIGIVSWGHGCAQIGYPGIYCDVATVRQWILNTAATL